MFTLPRKKVSKIIVYLVYHLKVAGFIVSLFTRISTYFEKISNFFIEIFLYLIFPLYFCFMKTTIIKETEKAYLLEKEDKTVFWVQKRWLRKDGSLTDKGLEAGQNSKPPLSKEEYKEKMNIVDVSEFISNPAKETEKALALNVTRECPHTDQFQNYLMWLPKSQIKGGKIPKWLWDKKLEEMENAPGGYSSANVQYNYYISDILV